MSDRDITENFHGGNERSKEAHAFIKPTKAAQRARVLEAIKKAGPDGLTSDEAEVLLGMSHQACSARFTELRAEGRLRCVGRRKTRSGRYADAWALETRESIFPGWLEDPEA